MTNLNIKPCASQEIYAAEECQGIALDDQSLEHLWQLSWGHN